MDPRKPGEDLDENWSPESGDSPERERIAEGELSFQEQLGRSACDQPDEEEEKKPETDQPNKG